MQKKREITGFNLQVQSSPIEFTHTQNIADLFGEKPELFKLLKDTDKKEYVYLSLTNNYYLKSQDTFFPEQGQGFLWFGNLQKFWKHTIAIGKKETEQGTRESILVYKNKKYSTALITCQWKQIELFKNIARFTYLSCDYLLTNTVNWGYVIDDKFKVVCEFEFKTQHFNYPIKSVYAIKTTSWEMYYLQEREFNKLTTKPKEYLKTETVLQLRKDDESSNPRMLYGDWSFRRFTEAGHIENLMKYWFIKK